VLGAQEIIVIIHSRRDIHNSLIFGMFVDEITINARAGKGGDGVVRFRHLKSKEFAGPSGGDGGRGGDVVFRAVRDLNKLYQYRNKTEFFAEDGESGKKESMEGRNGEPLIIDVPVGSIITHKGSDERWELTTEGQEISVLSGGKGGFGNERFKSSTNQAPKEATSGKPGEEGTFFIEVELVVDAGFVGFPNAGKSSLLNELTRAKRKVADYPFTTLEPGLGEMYGYILADIPGLIAGAAEGKGLGHKFLRHVKRTKILLHCVSLENENIGEAYETIRNELDKFDPTLKDKPELVILTKTDLVTEEEVAEAKRVISAKNETVYTVSIYDDESVKQLGDDLVAFLREQGNHDNVNSDE